MEREDEDIEMLIQDGESSLGPLQIRECSGFAKKHQIHFLNMLL